MTLAVVGFFVTVYLLNLNERKSQFRVVGGELAVTPTGSSDPVKLFSVNLLINA